MPDAVGGRSCGWITAGLSDRVIGSNSFDCGGYEGLVSVEANNDGLRTSAMVVKVEDEDEGVFADHLTEYLFMYSNHPTQVEPLSLEDSVRPPSQLGA